MTAPPKSGRERQEAFRARRAMLEGAQEVRGIYLPADLHAELKAHAKRLLQKRAKEVGTTKDAGNA